MNKNILVLGDTIDPHIAAVCQELMAQGASVLVLNPADGAEAHITYSYSPFGIRFGDAKQEIAHTDIDAVWWRLKPHTRNYPSSVEEMERAGFISREWQLALEPLRFFLQDAFWMNKRETDLLLRNKAYQLYQAGIHGFAIPKSIISNSFAAIEQCSQGFEEIMYKALGYFVAPPNKILFSNKMTAAALQASAANIAPAPCIFQNYIAKSYELRITIVGSEIFAVKILSQANDLSQSDWRRNQFQLQYEPLVLDDVFAQQLLHFHSSMGLVYAAYDFIVDKKGAYIFLEVNPSGQWLWLEEKLGLGISKQIARTLLQMEA